MYPAGEPIIKGADSPSLIDAIHHNLQLNPQRELKAEHLYYTSDVKQVSKSIMSHVQDGDVVITMGAGSISAIPTKLVEGL